MAGEFADHFSVQAADYTRYRPHYPTELFDYLASLCLQRNLAVDIATGNGQAAASLCDHFAHVIGCEPSMAQLRNARAQTSISYVCSIAEQLPFSGELFDLITVAQAVHWFDHGRFNAEVQRLLKPEGVLAVWGYGLFSITADIDALIDHFYSQTLAGFWPEERHWIETGYAGLPFPFARLESPVFHIEAEWNLSQVVGYLATWSATQRYLAEHHHNPLDGVAQQLTQLWGDPSKAKTVHWPIYLLVGLKR